MKIVGKIYHRTSQKVNKLYHKLNLDGILVAIAIVTIVIVLNPMIRMIHPMDPVSVLMEIMIVNYRLAEATI